MIAVGMLPPPMGGQALMFRRAIGGLQKYYELKVVDIQFQKNLGESGHFSLRKVSKFFSLFFGKMIALSLRKKFDILYYCVSGPGTFGSSQGPDFPRASASARGEDSLSLSWCRGRCLSNAKTTSSFASGRELVLFEPDMVLRPPSDANDSDTLQSKARCRCLQLC